MNDMIIAGKARVGIKIPVDYSDKLLHQMSAQVLVLIDGSDSSVAGQAINVNLLPSASTNPCAAHWSPIPISRGYASQIALQSRFPFAEISFCPD